MPLLLSSLQLTLEEKGPARIQKPASNTRAISARDCWRRNARRDREPRTASTSLRLKPPNPPPPPKKKPTVRQTLGCLRAEIINFCFKGSPHVTAALRWKRNCQNRPLGARKGETRGTEPRTRLNHTPGLILSKCSTTCTLPPQLPAPTNAQRHCRERLGPSRYRGGRGGRRPTAGGAAAFPSVSYEGPGYRPSPLRRAGRRGRCGPPSLLSRRRGGGGQRRSPHKAGPGGRRPGRSSPPTALPVRERGKEGQGRGGEELPQALLATAAQPGSRPPAGSASVA